MEKVKVMEVDRYRDGGTIEYRDELNRKYFLWYPTGKIYNNYPFPSGPKNSIPFYVKEIPVQLEIVNSF